jgi:DNA-binding LytR/AlgR family response regulator
MIPIYIIEDEPPAAEKLRLFLQRAEPESSISVFHDGVSALAALRAARPEIIFLDIEMPGLTGIELLEQLPPEERPQIIITSAYEKYALSGFRFNVTDYLLKPYSYAQLVEALGKAKEALRLQALDRRVQGDATSEAQETTLTIRTDLRTERIEVDRIIYVEAVKDYVRIVINGRRLLTQQTLTSIEAQLPADRFCRIHRSYLINTTQVKAYDRDSVTLSDGTTLTVGKTYKAKFNEIAKSIFKTGRK